MSEFRFKGLTAVGKGVQGIITAENYQSAKAKIQKLADMKNIEIQEIQKKKTFTFKIQKNGESKKCS